VQAFHTSVLHHVAVLRQRGLLRTDIQSSQNTSWTVSVVTETLAGGPTVLTGTKDYSVCIGLKKFSVPDLLFHRRRNED